MNTSTFSNISMWLWLLLAIMENNHKPVWIVAHRRELVSQIRETIERVFYSFLSKERGAFDSPRPSLANPDPPRPSLAKEGSTFSPSPSSSGSGYVAGAAIALPEFLYRQQSLCPQGADDDFSTQQSYDCLGGVNRLASNNSSDNSSLFTLCSSLIKPVSIQWLSKHFDEMGEEPGMIVIDEAHHALAETYKGLWDRYPKAKFLGLTATPCRLNRKGFTDLFDTLVTSYTVGKFIQMGYLAPFDYVSIRPDSEEQKLVDSLVKRGADGDYQNREMDRVLNTRPSIERLFRSLCDFGKGKKGIVYAINIEHAKAIAEFYREHGVAAVAIDSKTPANERKELIERFQNSSLQVLVNVDIFSEGFDCPDVEFIQLARPTLSLAKYLQMVGRGLRIAKGKKACMIIDNVGLYRMFGLPTMPWNWQAMFRGRFFHKRIVDYRQMLLKGNDWERLVALPDSERGDDPEIMVLMKHEQLMDHGKSTPVKRLKTTADSPHPDYRIEERKLGYGIFKVLADRNRYGILRLEDKHVIVPPICRRQIQIFPDYTAKADHIDGRNVVYADLISERRFEAVLITHLSPHIFTFGNIQMLRVKNEFYTRTRKSYVTVFPISKDDISFHGFYLLIHDPMAKRKMPVCVIENDVTQYYWLVETMADGSICVITEDEVYYQVMPNGKKKKIKDIGDVETPRAETAPIAPRIVEPVKIGNKWGLKVDGKLFVAPVYRSIIALNREYFAIETLPGQWGIMNLAGKVVVEPQYAKVEMKSDHEALLIKVNGQTKLKMLD